MKHLHLLLFALVFTACDVDEDDPAEAEGTAREEACEHMIDGPSTSITATTDPTDAPLAQAEHTRIDITLEQNDDTYDGVVRFEADAEADYAIYLNEAVIFSVTDANGVRLEPRTDIVPDCFEVAVEHVLPLTVGTWYLTFNNVSKPVLGLVHETVVDESSETDGGVN